MDDLTIVVFCNRLDFYLTRICVSSIRFFYPEIKIQLVKDQLNGNFSTRELEQKFKVEIYDCGKKTFGWAASKTFFLLQAPRKKKYLLLDSDIVFIEPFLERVYKNYQLGDIIVSGEHNTDIYADHIKKNYFDVNAIVDYDNQYEYPGFFFNTGQIFITGGAITYDQMRIFFDMEQFPYWKRLDILPTVDQSVYNYLFPKLDKEKSIKLVADNFMIWSESKEAKEIQFPDIVDGQAIGGLIHWAGAKRTPVLKKMSRADILTFFQDQYYDKIFQGSFLKNYRTISYIFYTCRLRLKNKVKKILNEKNI